MKKVETLKTLANRLFNGLAGAFFVFALLSACLPAVINAEVPVKFTYQGNLRQNGFLVNGQRPMVFRIYASSISAAELWTSPAYDVSLSTGVFRVTLEPATITDWQTGSLWLELEIEGNRMSPREELTSSPYAINSLMLSGKRYSTSASEPTASVPGELWFDSVNNVVKFWNGTMWVDTSGGGIPGAHAALHAGGGSDPIVSLGTHAVTGYITVSSSVTAGWYYGDGSGIYNLNASAISYGYLSGDRIGSVIVSTHIVDGSIQAQDIADNTITRAKLNQSGCASGEILQWGGSEWVCGSGAAAGLEVDPLSIHNQDTLQVGTTFYVSSGTANDLNVINTLKVEGTAFIKGAPGQQGLSVDATGNVGIGVAGASARLEVRGEDTQAYSLAVGTGTAHQVVVSTSGAVGIGTETPRAKVEVSGGEDSGEYIMIFNSGTKLAAWLRNK
ncbi:MAG: hypothetical protein CVU79_01145 [Elusimicrobia bacterium HGW-Elusimicrobia-3]|nr:MAG: hypothetical protein CVU79_01145 [Elusimicrobia bacterium HGW-Elusimicrobia-3]